MKKEMKQIESNDLKKIGASVKSKLVTRLKPLLLPVGFIQTKNAFWNRFTKTMRHSFEFRQTSNKFDIRYGYLVLDKYGTEENYTINMNENVYSCLWEKRWALPTKMAKIDEYVHELVAYVNEGLLFFEQYMESSQLVIDYENGLIDKLYFAEDPGWQAYLMGIAYFNSENFQAAINSFQEVVGKWSDKNLDFIQTRKRTSELWIQEIQKRLLSVPAACPCPRVLVHQESP